MKKQQGFTLIELMIVVAIIGILAAIALPAYQDYTTRARVSEGITLASGAKTAVTEYYASENVMPTSNESAGLATDVKDISGDSVHSVGVMASGAIVVYFTKKVDETKKIILMPNATGGSIKWECQTDLDAGVVPATCRHAITATGVPART